MHETNCERYEALCSAAIDNALTKQEQKELDAHLAECPSCRAYLEELRTMRSLWKELETPMPPALHEKIMSEIEAEVQKTIVQTPQKHRRRPPVFTMLAAAAACVILAVSGNLTGLFGQLGAGTIASNSAADNSSAQGAVGPSVAEGTAQIPSDGSTLTEGSGTGAADAAADAAAAPDTDAADTPQADQTQPEADDAEAAPETRVAERAPAEKDSDAAGAGSAEAQTFSATSDENSGIMTASLAPEDAAPALSSRSIAAASNVPQEVAQMSFSRCYDVTPADSGTAEGLPVIDGMALIIEQDGVAYYSVEDNESKMEKVRQALEKNGYTVTLNQSSGLTTTQRDDAQILLMVRETV